VQPTLFDVEDESDALREQRSGSFADNLQLPVHRWFRYSAGFSASWVCEAIRQESQGRPLRVFDPFVGSGTVVLACEQSGVEGIGVEAHPFVARIARAKLHWREDPDSLLRLGTQIARAARKTLGSVDGYSSLITKCYPTDTLLKLDAIKSAWQAANDGGPLCSRRRWVASAF